jgi:hypothetical protein
MSSSIPTPSDLQLTPEIQTFFKQLLNQKLKERDDYYLGRIQAREEELEARRAMREQQYQEDIAARHATLESVSRQLEESRANQMWVSITIVHRSFFIVHRRNAMDHMPSLPSNSTAISKTSAIPPLTSQSQRRSPTRKAMKPRPLPKPQTQRQQPTQSAASPPAEVKKPAMHVHRMLRAEVPADATGVQVR